MQQKKPYSGWVTLILGTAMLLACTLLTTSRLAAETDQSALQPDIKFEEKVYKFGTVQKGDKVPHVFKFKNTGQGVLKINSVKTTCGCTVPKNYTKELQPGAEGRIEVTFDSTNFMGAIHKTIYVNSNDPDEPKVSLSIRGTVVADVVIQPPRNLFFGLIQKGETVTKSFMVNQTGSKELKVLKVEANPSFISTKFIPQPKNNRNHYKVEVTIAADAPEGIFRGNLKIHTNIDKFRIIPYTVMGTVKAKVAKPTGAPVQSR